MKHCTIIPSKGKALFRELKKQYGYDIAREVFLVGISPRFKQDYKETLSLNAEGVPSLESLVSNSYIQELIGDAKIIQTLMEGYPVVKDTIEAYSNAVESAYRFNTNSPYKDKFVATVEYTDDSQLQVTINRKTDALVDKFNNQYSSLRLNERLAKIFESLGITVGRLTEAETSAGRVGVTDFSKARTIANDFSSMIRVANNMEGAQAISEEFSHLIIGTLKDEPLVKRTIAYLVNNPSVLTDILGDTYEDISLFYDGNKELIAEEAVGHILQKNLLNESNKPQLPLYRRLIEFIKGLFKHYNVTEVDDAIAEADSAMSKIAKDILNGTRKLSKSDIENSYREQQFNALSERIEKNIEVLKEAAKTEAKRYKITKGSKRDIAKAAVEEILEYTTEDSDTVEGMFNYAQSALSELRSLNTLMAGADRMTLPQKFGVLRNVRTYIQSYGNFIQSMKDRMLEEESEEDNMFLRDFEVGESVISIKDVIDELSTLSNDLTRRYMRTAVPAFSEFLKPFMGDSITIKGNTVTVEDLIRETDSDISFFDRWLDSMGDSSDSILQGVDAAVKQQKDIIRTKSIASFKDIQKWRNKAEQAGITDFEWMFEKDSDGNKSGNYISEVNYAQFNADRKALEERLEAKYGKNPTGEEAQSKIRERNEWLRNNALQLFGAPEPDPHKYRNAEYDALSDTKKTLLKEYLYLKDSFDKLYPKDRVATLKAVQMRKSKTQRFLDSTSSPSTLFSNIQESVKDSFLDRADDDQLFGTSREKKGLTDFAGNEFLTLPVLYTNRLEDPNEISTDVVGALMCYAYGAHTFDGMDKIIDPLEVGRVLITENRKVRKTRGGSKLIEKFESLDMTVANKVFLDSNNIAARYEDFMESQVYQRYLKDEGNIGDTKINKNKTVSWMLNVSSTAQLGFNWLANLANVATGVCMQNIEAASQEFFSPKELMQADKIYAKEIIKYVAEVGSRTKTSKLALFMELLNVKQDFSSTAKRVQKKNLLERFFGSNVAFLGQEAGDNWLYNRTAIAMALKQKVKVPNKGVMPLWEALQIVDRYEGDSSIKEMILPKGTTNVDGSEVDLHKLSRTIAHVNQHLFGIYNDEDANAANRVALGRLLLQYRKWMKPQFNKRFQKSQYSVLLGREEEGYYRTLLKVANELARGRVQIGAAWNSLSDHERANVRRALTEIVQFLAVAAAVRFIDWGDDKKRPWAIKLAEYTARRLKHELGGLTPGLTMAQELKKTVSTPMASLSVIQSSINLINSLLSPEDWVDELQSGPYKGMSSLEKNFLKAPIPGITHYRQIDRFIDDIDTSISFYVRPY